MGKGVTMRQRWYRYAALVPLVVLALVAAACGRRIGVPAVPTAVDGPTVTASDARMAATHAGGTPPSVVPPLPFAENPDPTQCGIPTPWGNGAPAWITGFYQGQLFQPPVFLYDSHGRREVMGQMPHSGRVRIVLTQANPALNYYFVRSLDLQPAQEGWIPAPCVALAGPPPPLP